jgi:hypothetical protein
MWPVLMLAGRATRLPVDPDQRCGQRKPDGRCPQGVRRTDESDKYTTDWRIAEDGRRVSR